MIKINNLTKGYLLGRVDKKLFSAVAKKVLLGENRGTETLSLAFVGKAEIKKLNNKFRKKNKPTDVLSFEISAQGGPASGGKDYLGEIVICPEIVKENAEKYRSSTKNEMLKVFVHGILHLCGYDHPATAGSRRRRDEKLEKTAEIMATKQEKYLSNFR